MNIAARMLFPVSAIACMAVPAGVVAQAYPAKPIKVVSSAPLGSSGDTALRLVTAKMVASMGWPLVVESTPGAGGTVAARNIMRAPADGYTILYTSSGPMLGAVFLTKDLGYDPLNDLTHISQLVEGGSFLAVTAALPVNSVKELLDYAKKNPGKLSYGSNGIGSNFHMVGEAFKMAAGVDILHVPYSAAKMSIPIGDLLAGRLDVHFPSFSLIGPHLATGKVKLLAAMGSKRIKRMPDVPALTESLPNYKGPPSWFAVFGPPKLSQPITARLQGEMAKALAEPDVSGRLNDIGITPLGTMPEAFAAAHRTDLENLRQLIGVLGLKPQ